MPNLGDMSIPDILASQFVAQRLRAIVEDVLLRPRSSLEVCERGACVAIGKLESNQSV